jgi:uncharacterized membrane protein
MLTMVTGLVLFFLVHLVPTQPDLRAGIIARFGAAAYRTVFAIASFAGLALIVIGYGKLQVMAGKNPQIWVPPAGMRHLALLLMVPAMILLVATYVPSRIRTAVKHPMLLATKLWAVSHLLANGDLASIVLFGSFLVYAVYDMISVKRRAALGPLGTRQGGLAGDMTAVLGGLLLYAVIVVWAHQKFIGVAPVALSFAP